MVLVGSLCVRCVPVASPFFVSAASPPFRGTVEPITSVQITSANVAVLDEVLKRSRLRQYTPSHLVKLFNDAAGGSATLTKQQFDGVIRDIIPGGSLSAKSKAFLSFTLTSIFLQFANNADGTVCDLAVCLCLSVCLCIGVSFSLSLLRTL